MATPLLAGFIGFGGPAIATAAEISDSTPSLENRPSGPREAAVRSHVAALKKRLGDSGFTIVVESPFVVIGDESPATVRQRAVNTVRWAVDRLKQAYFAKDPDSIIDIWLFKDKSSYEANCKRLFKQTPTTPYGFYSDTDRAMVMNIATGGGTLVHEIVHPFIATNFPSCPAWFNEGLGSLYEQSGEGENGEIIGRTNWRLAGLQNAIQRKKTIPFREFCTMSDEEFRGKNEGTNYAQARYLCYYLQTRGLLRKFYREFTAHAKDDPGGYQTLKRVLGRDEAGMPTFQKDWERFVLRLEFPEP